MPFLFSSLLNISIEYNFFSLSFLYSDMAEAYMHYPSTAGMDTKPNIVTGWPHPPPHHTPGKLMNGSGKVVMFESTNILCSMFPLTFDN